MKAGFLTEISSSDAAREAKKCGDMIYIVEITVFARFLGQKMQQKMHISK